MSTFTACGAVGLALLTTACGSRIETVEHVPSPDRKLSADLFRVDPGGGATVGFTTYLYLNRAGRDHRKKPLFEGYSCGVVSASWRDDRTVEVAYDPGCRIIGFTNRWWDDSDSHPPRDVELVLVRRR